MVIRVEDFGTGWISKHDVWICQSNKESKELSVTREILVRQIDGLGIFTEKFVITDFPDLLEDIERCEFRATGVFTMDAQDDRVYRMNEDGSEDLLLKTDGVHVAPVSNRIYVALICLINILKMVRDGKLQLENGKIDYQKSIEKLHRIN